jgi:hypothetical protein
MTQRPQSMHEYRLIFAFLLMKVLHEELFASACLLEPVSNPIFILMPSRNFEMV